MPQDITVRVELGPYVLLGREVEALEVTQAVGDHARCTLTLDRDPRSARAVAALHLAELADAAVRVVFFETSAPDGGCLAFAGRVREAHLAHGPAGAGRFTVTALSDSYVLAAHAERRYFSEHTPPALAAALGVAVSGAVPAGASRDYVQRGESAWAFLARLAATEGLQLRAAWARSPEATPPPEPAELGVGFGSVTHALTWGRDLLEFATVLRPTNAGVTGAFYDPAEKHDHRFRGVRRRPGWLGGAQPIVASADAVATRDADGGDPGYVEVGGAGGARARTLEEFRARLERASEARAGSAVLTRGASTDPALRAGDRITVQEGGALDALASSWGADVGAAERGGTYGLTRVSHLWGDGLYTNSFTATPWADYHPTPPDVERQLALRAAVDGGADGLGIDGAGGAAAAGGFALAVVTDNADPDQTGSVRIRYPWMAEGEQSRWVRIAGLGGGNARGLGVLPSVGDEVVVAAVAGDPEHPVVLGALWNGVDRASHEPGRQVWITPAGNTLVFLEGKPGADQGTAETAELYTPAAKTWMQLAQKGPTGVPTVTLHSEGDLSLEAPNGQLRIRAKRYVAHVAGAHDTWAGGAHTTKAQGAVVTESSAGLALKAAADVVVRAGGALTAHAADTNTLVGAQVAVNPPGATAPAVTATVPALPRSAWGPRPVPGPGPGRSTEDPKTPTRKELAAKAQKASLTAPAAAPGASTAVAAVPPDAGAPPPFAPLPPGGCADAWRGVMAQTNAVLNAGGGDGTPAQKLARNRAISAAYARLAMGDDRMRWAGVASVVSTQAHCAMQDADTAVGRADAAERAASNVPTVGPVLGAGVAPIAGMAHEVQDALYDTNREIFSDIYPAVAMYKQYGMAGVAPRKDGGCGDERSSVDRPMPPALQDALRQIDSGKIAQGSLTFANYEQTIIVQDRIYDDPERSLLKPAMKINQVVSGIPGVRQVANALMRARKPEVAISTECGQGTPVPFRGDITVAQDRVGYYRDLMQAYLTRDQAARDAMGAAIEARDPLTGGPDYTYPPPARRRWLP